MNIEATALTKNFDGLLALDGLTLHVPQGAVYGMVGPNGAGKSTAIRHITGIYRQDSGELLINGVPVFENPEIKARIGYIPDDVFTFPTATIADMAKFYRRLYPRYDMERFNSLAEIFAIDPKRQLRKLSKGMQKQAAFWLTISMRPDLLVLDEPVDGLDPVMRRQVWSLVMADVAENGTTVLVSSHNLRELEDVCDHVGIMNHGKMTVERSLSELQDNITKIQLALPDGGKLPDDLDILHHSSTGRLQLLILRGKAEELTNKLAATSPLFMDVVPLTLEEIFIYELGGADYADKELII